MPTMLRKYQYQYFHLFGLEMMSISVIDGSAQVALKFVHFLGVESGVRREMGKVVGESRPDMQMALRVINLRVA